MTGRPPLSHAYPDEARSSLLAANGMFLFAGVGLVLLNLLAPQLARLMHALFGAVTQLHFQAGIESILYPLFFLLPVALFMRRRGGGAMRLSGVGFGMMILCLATGFACVLLAAPISAVWVMILEALGISAARAQIVIATEGDLLLGIFAIGVLPGIFEELLFRGPILSAYERGGSRRGILVSAALFAMMHGSLEGLPVQLMMGAVLGYAVVSTGSIYAGMMIHTAYNAAYVLLSYALRDAAGAAALEGAGAQEMLVGLLADGAIGFIVLFALLRFFRRHRARRGIAPFPGAAFKMGAPEAIVLISGVVTTLFLYANNIFDIVGYLR